MSAAELFGLIVSILVFVYLDVRAAARREALGPVHDGPGLASDRVLRGGADRADALARRLHGARVPGRARGACARAGAGRAADLPGGRHEPRARADVEELRAHDGRVLRAVLAGAVRDPARAGDPLLQPDRVQRRALGRHLQHDVLVHHQHQLAVLQRRDDDVVPVADGRPGRAELRLGRGRHGRAGGDDPRLRAAQRGHARQLLGGRNALAALHPAAAVADRRAPARLPGSRADARGPRILHDGDRRRPDTGPRPGRLADRDQAARHERRRVLQHELGDAVREPDSARELHRGAVHPADPGGTDGDLRADGRQPPAGLDALLGDAGDVHRRHRGRLPRGAARLARAPRSWNRDERRRRQHRWQPPGRRAAFRDRQLRAVGDSYDGRLQRVGQLRPRGLHRHRRHSCRSPTWRPGR